MPTNLKAHSLKDVVKAYLQAAEIHKSYICQTSSAKTNVNKIEITFSNNLKNQPKDNISNQSLCIKWNGKNLKLRNNRVLQMPGEPCPACGGTGRMRSQAKRSTTQSPNPLKTRIKSLGFPAIVKKRNASTSAK